MRNLKSIKYPCVPHRLGVGIFLIVVLERMILSEYDLVGGHNAAKLAFKALYSPHINYLSLLACLVLRVGFLRLPCW